MNKDNFSLLWPAGTQPRTDRQLSSEAIRDLALETLVGRMCPFNLHQQAVRTVLYQLCPDAAVLPLLDELMLFGHPHFGGETSLHEVIQRAGELQLLVDCVQRPPAQ